MHDDAGASVPAPLRVAAILGAVESLLGIAYGLFLVGRDVLGYRDRSAVFVDSHRAAFLGFGTGVVFIIFFGVVLCAGRALFKGKRWGRGPIVMEHMLLLPVAYWVYLAGLIPVAVILGVVGILGLGLLFNGPAVRWAAAQY